MDGFIKLKNFDKSKTGVVKSIEILFYDHESEPLLCDGCDRKKPCVHLDFLGNVFILCKDCVQDILDGFNE